MRNLIQSRIALIKSRILLLLLADKTKGETLIQLRATKK